MLLLHLCLVRGTSLYSYFLLFTVKKLKRQMLPKRSHVALLSCFTIIYIHFMSISFDVKESFSVENYCDIERRNQNIELKSFLVDDERKLIYCWNHKVASSFFTDLFVRKKVPKNKNIIQGIFHCCGWKTVDKTKRSLDALND